VFRTSAAVEATPVRSLGPTAEELASEVQVLQSQLSLKDAELLSMSRSLDALRAVNQASSVHYANELTKLRTLPDVSAQSSPSVSPAVDEEVTFSSEEDDELAGLSIAATSDTKPSRTSVAADNAIVEAARADVARLEQSVQALHAELQLSRVDVDRVRAQYEAQLDDLRRTHADSLDAARSNITSTFTAEVTSLREENALLRDRFVGCAHALSVEILLDVCFVTLAVFIVQIR
jgi:hypothetical protein